MSIERSKPLPAVASAPSDGADQVFVGRQPILNNQGQLFGYELLFRGSPTAVRADFVGAAQATSRLLVNAFGNIGLEQVLGDKKAFINISTDLLMSDVIESLPPHKIVLEILETVEPTADVVERCQQLRARGFQLALDDFEYDPSWEPLLNLAAFVKLDIKALGMARIGEAVRRLRGRGLRFIAEKVETRAEVEVCRAALINYYQGYYFARPETLNGKRIDPGVHRVIEIFNLVTSHAEPGEIEKRFKQDVSLSYQILRYINAVGFGLLHKVETIHHALVVLGHQKLLRWLSLLMLAGGKGGEQQALFRTALVRARATELLGKQRLPAVHHDNLFMTGMFSLLDTLLDMPLQQALRSVNLPDDVRQALLDGCGPYAPFLKLACAGENLADTAVLERLAASAGVDIGVVGLAQIEALAWAEGLAA